MDGGREAGSDGRTEGGTEGGGKGGRLSTNHWRDCKSTRIRSVLTSDIIAGNSSLTARDIRSA